MNSKIIPEWRKEQETRKYPNPESPWYKREIDKMIEARNMERYWRNKHENHAANVWYRMGVEGREVVVTNNTHVELSDEGIKVYPMRDGEAVETVAAAAKEEIKLKKIYAK